MNIQSILNQTTNDFKSKGSTSARLDAEVLLFHYLNTDRLDLFKYPDKLLSFEELCGFQNWIKRHEEGEPIAYITGQKEFWSLNLEVNYDVLIPRPETESLVEEVLKVCLPSDSDRHLEILDVGTGSGAISVALAFELKNVHIVATDISQKAIKVAMRNAKIHNVQNKISFLVGNLFSPISGTFDIIISNPPYIANELFDALPIEIKNFEPKIALLGGPQGTLFHQRLITEAKDYLNSSGWLMMEIGTGQKVAVKSMFKHENSYEDISFIKDLSGIERIVIARRKN